MSLKIYRGLLSAVFTLLAAAFLCLSTGCQRHTLGVETRYIDACSLASNWVHTPDPKKYYPTTGQELIVWWRLPYEHLCHNDLHVKLTIRFKDKQEETLCIPIRHFCGNYTYKVVNDKYWDHCGILTYKAEVFGGDCLLDQWHHHIWAEWITFSTDTDSDSCQGANSR